LFYVAGAGPTAKAGTDDLGTWFNDYPLRDNVTIASRKMAAWDLPFGGQIDEVRVSNVERSADWAIFEADNIANYGATITHGAWTAVAAATSPYYYRETVLNRRLR